ncbi:hypothetical protein, partial [Bradyrhizobium japonicum]
SGPFHHIKFGHVKMNAPWVRHLRRSPGVRSLNFFQGMPLVSAGGGLSTREFEDFFRFAVACVR